MQRFRQFISNLNPATIIWALVIVGLILGAASRSLALGSGGNPDTDWWMSFLQNLSAGMFGSAVTFWLIDVVFGGRKEREAKENADVERKRAIIKQMGSPVNDAALEAVRLVKLEGWDKDGSLQGADLAGANLQGAILEEADMQRANLTRVQLETARLIDANLRDTVLINAYLQEANMDGTDLHQTFMNNANLQRADLNGANLQMANMPGVNAHEAVLSNANLRDSNLYKASLRSAQLFMADLQGARLYQADLGGVYLHEANLQGAEFRDTNFDGSTTLPDYSNWTPDTDLSRFTDPKHPNFWRSDNPNSPAYRGKKEPD